MANIASETCARVGCRSCGRAFPWPFGGAGFVLSIITPCVVSGAPAGTVIHSFEGGVTGDNPMMGTLVQDQAGALYGTTSGVESGLKSGGGTIFQLQPPAKRSAKWTFANIYRFPPSPHSDPGYPIGALAIDFNGDLYGTTTVGLVFELSPPQAGATTWQYQTIYDLTSQKNNTLVGDLLLYGSGTIVGVSQANSTNPNGSAFELVPPANGQGAWSYTLIYSFQGGTDGAHPSGGLIADGRGNLYGATLDGGLTNSGTVFELSPPTGGATSWTSQVLYSFLGGDTDGSQPICTLIFDKSGSLYGTTEKGGKGNVGTVFRLSPPQAGQTVWSETILHYFPASTGSGPLGGVIEDSNGNLYGTTQTGPGTGGQVFKLEPPAAGKAKWATKILWDFPTPASGTLPQGSLLSSGSPPMLYGTTEAGGLEKCKDGASCGTVYGVSPK